MTDLILPDTSRWQDEPGTVKSIDFVTMKNAGASGVFMKASQATYTDPIFLTCWKNAKAAGMIRGAYHYLDWSIPAKDQAVYFCNLLAADPGELPPVVDYEEDYGIPVGHLDLLRAFVTEVEARTQRIPMIYVSPGFWHSYGSADPYWARFPLWDANWYTNTPIIPAPWKDFAFQQYTNKGDGIAYGVESLQIDLNRYRGTMDQLRAFCNLPALPVPPVQQTKYITNLSVNVRSGPGDTDTIIDVLAKGTEVLVSSIYGNRSFVSTPNIGGWVWTEYLTLVPVIAPTLDQRVANLEREARAKGWNI